MKGKEKSIKAQIFHGYFLIGSLLFVLVTISIFCLFFIYQNYQTIVRNRTNQNSTQSAVIGHYVWLEDLSDALKSEKKFTGTLDPSACSLGQWISQTTEEDLHADTIVSALDSVKMPHENIHNIAREIIALTDSQKAYSRYLEEVKPQVTQIISQLNLVSARYGEIADAASKRLQAIIMTSIVLEVLLACCSIWISLHSGTKIAKRISEPVSAIAEWSKELSKGTEALQLDDLHIEQINTQEILTMMKSFSALAASIQENANVVKRVAEGDMTAFVNIRSSKDSLGKNLYRMVQSNDLLFAEILQIARTVANGSEQIAKTSETLADSATVQANAVQNLSSTIERAGQIIEDNTKKTRTAFALSEEIKVNAEESNVKMQTLVTSVSEIQAASEKISAVIKSIDDIAFQTNILALNAAIEAARAGEAGKGFSVVANEVRSLALRSATAAEESKNLIQNSIMKTKSGSQISAETSAMFAKTVENLKEITSIITEISSSSEEQLGGITQIRTEIGQIAEIADSNADASQESALASQDMRKNADLLHAAMQKFNLRKRHKGQAYIPPEKVNDPEFIRRANENYQKALETGQYGYELTELEE